MSTTSGQNSSRRVRPARCRRGLTLVELVTTLAITSILFLAMGNAVYIASKALPGKTDTGAMSVQASQVLDQIASEIETAICVPAITSRSITFTVSDRTSDANAERISYSWSGVVGDPLVRTYNGTSWPVIDKVATFNLIPNVRHVSEDYTAPGVEDAVPSVMLDYTSLLSNGTDKFGTNSNTNFGQYLAPTFTSDVIAWRPTSVMVMMSLDRTPGSYRVQMREASPSIVPRATVLEERTVSSATLTILLFLAQTYTFSSVPRQAPTNPLCLTMMWASGVGPGKIQTCRTADKLLKTTSGPSSWTVSSTESIAMSLSGVAMRAGARKTATTQYLLSLGMSLGAGATAGGPVVQTTAVALNHPEILTGAWEVAFDRDPTLTDANGDGVGDWVATPGPTFNMAQVVDGAWSPTSGSLVSQPDANFAETTIVDLRMQPVGSGATAGFTINAGRSADRYFGISTALKLETDGTQTLSIQQATGASTYTHVISYSLMAAQPTDIRLIIDPVAAGVNVSINGSQKGTFPISAVTAAGTPRSASLTASGGTVKFWHARVRTLRSMP